MRLVIGIVLFAINAGIHGQELSFKHFTVKDGLPGSIVYHTLQDKNGFIWFATNQGVSRFDGKTFTNFTREDGLPDNEIIKLYLDKFNNIWFISFVGVPSAFTNGHIKRFDDCKQVIAVCEDRLTDSIILLTRFDVFEDSAITIYKSANNNSKWQFTQSCKKDAPDLLPYRSQMLQASSVKDINFYFSYEDTVNYGVCLKDRSIAKLYIYKKGPLSMFLFPFSNKIFFSVLEDHKSIVFYSPDSLYIASFEKLKVIASLSQLKLNYKDIISIYSENDSTLWFCSRRDGLVCIKNYFTSHISIHKFFTQSFCTSIIKDKENGYWVSTYNDGVYFLPNLNFFTLSEDSYIANQNALCIRALNKKQLGVGFANGKIIIINHANQSWKPLPCWAHKDKSNYVLDLWSLGQYGMLIGTDQRPFLISCRKKKELPNDPVKGLYVSDTNIFIGNLRSIVEFDKHGNFIKTIFKKRVTCITGTGNLIYWGTMEGIYSYSNGRVEFITKRYPTLSGVIHHLDIATDSSLWISTPHGLVVLKNATLVNITKEDGLCSNACKQVSFDKGTAWIATDKGISRVNFHWTFNKLSYTVSNITQEDGLISNDVNQTAVGGNYIWAATAAGVCWFSKNYTSHSALPPFININRIVCSGISMPANDTIRIKNQESKLLIELSGVSFRSGKQVSYEYRLTGIDSNWSKTSNNLIEFPTLPFGEFIFEAKAIDRWGVKSERTKKIIIINLPPFWKTNWFLASTYLILAVLLGLGFSLYFRWRTKKREEKYQLTQKVYDLEMIAFRSQMNPHFVFNCLTSIQYYIIRYDIRNANEYLHKFSTLIRQTLQNSIDSTILLREEIRILTLYLELEKLRLNDRMEYRLIVSDEIDQDAIYIPNMIIQPFIENAIKHGIAPLQDRNGIINIEINKSLKYIEVVIEDNGPGIHARQNSERFKKDYTSMGTGITVRRINAINAIQKNKILYRVTDKRQSGQLTPGTIIHILFPLKP